MAVERKKTTSKISTRTATDSIAVPSTAKTATRSVTQDGLRQVLAIEDELRASVTELELLHTLTNRLRDLVGARQVIALRRKTTRKWRVVCMSSVATVERDAPFVRAIEAFVAADQQNRSEPTATTNPLRAAHPGDEELFSAYPFRHTMWAPLRLRQGSTFAGLLFLRETEWDVAASDLIGRETSVAADIWSAISGRRRLQPVGKARRYISIFGFVAALGALAIPVPLTTMAPVKIVPDQPELVTAPLAGVIDSVLVDPNQMVTRGQTLVRFADTELRNAHKLAQHAADVAESRYRQLLQAAFSDPNARHELGIAQAELKLRVAERKYAQERLEQSQITASTTGLLIYPDKNDLLGRPVSVGERLMRIAPPNAVAAEISLPVSDAIILKQGGSARLFLDATPTQSLNGKIRTESYHAKVDDTGVLAYRVRIDLSETANTPRLGSRGTAQLIGDDVALGFFLFRRPITWIRQNLGL